MRVLVVAGYGLIGSYVLARLHAAGHHVVGAGRAIEPARRRFPFATWLKADLNELRSPADWTPHLAGIDAVVNCAGALQDSFRDDLHAVHVAGPKALYQACAAQGIRRAVHVSAAGVSSGRSTAFNATKLEAEQLLAGLDLDLMILRPGLVLAPSAYGGTALLRGLAAFPWFVPAVYPDSVVQVISVEDVAEAVLRCLEPGAPTRGSVDLVHESPTTLGLVLEQFRAWLGLGRAPLLKLPPLLAQTSAVVSDGLAYLGWRSPMRTTSVEQLRHGVSGRAEDCEAAFGFRPKSLEEMLAGWPSGVQERWFAKLYFLKPAVIATLAAFWLLSGTIALTISRHQAAAMLVQSGIPLFAAQVVTAATSVLDIGLAISACFRRLAPFALKGMIAVSAAYLIGACVLRPSLWADPLGPLVKIVPAIVLSLVGLAIMDER